MKIGVRGHDYGKGSVQEIAEKLAAEGYEAVQLSIPKIIKGVEQYHDITPSLIEEIHTVFQEKKIEIAVLGCYMDLGNPDKEVRERAVTIFKQQLSYSKVLGARVTGTETGYPKLSKIEKRQWYPYMMDSLKQINEEAQRLDVNYAIEPVWSHPLEDAELAREVVEQLGSHAKIILDPVNILERPDMIRQDRYWEYCLELLGDRIEAIHLKDFVYDEKGDYKPVRLGQGVMQYSVLENWLKKHPDIAVLREEMNLATAAQDLEFMRQMQQRVG